MGMWQGTWQELRGLCQGWTKIELGPSAPRTAPQFCLSLHETEQMSVGLQSRIRGSLLRVVSYNPMSLIQSRRALDISEELSADLIGLQGTRSRFVPRPGVGDRYTVRRHPRHWELSWGWQNTRHSNRSAGCSIFVKTRRWRKRDLCQVYSTPAVLQGRVGGARLRTGRSDVAMLVAYFPPKP